MDRDHTRDWLQGGHEHVDTGPAGIMAVVRRRLWPLLAWMCLSTALTVVLLTRTTPLYRSEAVLLLDPRVQQVSEFKSVVSGLFTTQDVAPIMRSEVQVLQSRKIASEVIDELGLEHSRSFNSAPAILAQIELYVRSKCSLLLPALCVSPPEKPADADGAHVALVDRYLKRLSVFNDGRSFILSVSFEDSDPVEAALIANTHTKHYIAAQRMFKRQAAERGGIWIEQQITRLRADVAARERALATLQEKSGLVTAQGATLVAQQVTHIVSQLAQARADLSQQIARGDAAQIAARQGLAASQGDVINSSLVQRLREQEAMALQEVASVAQQFGPNHPAVRAAQAKLAEAGRKIAVETQRVNSANDSSTNIAKERVQGLETSLAQLERQLSEQSLAASHYAELERDVTAYRSVYQGLLNRQQELAVSAGTEEADARIMSQAAPALQPFFPNKSVLLGLSLMVSGGIGVAAAVLTNRRGRGFETIEQLRAAVGKQAMHSIPLVKRGRHALADYVINRPKTEFAEAFRFLRGDIVQALLKARSEASGHVLAITSVLPREGKTTIAVCLARSLSASGLHVLLIDADLRRPQVARMAGIKIGENGLVALLNGRAQFEEAIVQDHKTTLTVLAPEVRVDTPQDLLGGSEFAALIADGRARFDIVVVDTPPQGAVSDVFGIAPLADATILLVRWKSTPASIVRIAMQAFEKRDCPLAGVFLNAVDRSALGKTDPDLRLAYKSARNYHLAR